MTSSVKKASMTLILAGKKQETPDTFSFQFKCDGLRTWKPGQYLHYTLEHKKPDSRGVERYFTIASAPFESRIMLTTRFAQKSSTFKKALKELAVGEILEADGLEGDFVVEDAKNQHVFIAGGIGVTPYRAILLDLNHKKLPINVLLLYANRDENFVYREEFEALTKKHPNFKIRYFVEPKRIVESTILEAVGDMGKPIFYVSGPEPMVGALEKMFKGMGVPKVRLKTDYFPGYDWP
jgi:ferredoxin-NADP reductase